MDEPTPTLAWGVVGRLASQYGPRLQIEVRDALESRTDYYLDPVALGALLVAITQFAWTVYSDRKRQAPDTTSEAAARELRTEIRREFEMTSDAVKITEAVVHEITERTDTA